MKKIMIITALLVVFVLAINPITAMNKAELIEAIASDASLTKADARGALDAFIGATSKSLKGGNRVALVGFGSFSISKRKARTGRQGAAVNSGIELVRFKSGDMPFLPNVEYTTTEDIIKMIATSAGEETKREEWNDINNDGRIHIAKQFMNSFTDVIIKNLQAGKVVYLGEDFGTFYIPRDVVLSNAKIHETKNGKTIRTPTIGHVDHGKGRTKYSNIVLKRGFKFKAGSDLSTTVKSLGTDNVVEELELAVEMIERKRPGRVKYSDITLERMAQTGKKPLAGKVLVEPHPAETRKMSVYESGGWMKIMKK